jgi:DNA replication protein DnaC
MNKKNSNDKEGEAEQINVFIRIRPMRNEHSKKSLKIIDKGVAFHYKDKIHQLYFDGVFDDTFSQQRVFESGCLPIVKDVLQGNNASLFVYGQTGTGKTFTMGTL